MFPRTPQAPAPWGRMGHSPCTHRTQFASPKPPSNRIGASSPPARHHQPLAEQGAGVEPTLLLGEAEEEPREEEEEQLLCLQLGVGGELLCQPCSIALISPAPPFLMNS